MQCSPNAAKKAQIPTSRLMREREHFSRSAIGIEGWQNE